MCMEINNANAHANVICSLVLDTVLSCTIDLPEPLKRIILTVPRLPFYKTFPIGIVGNKSTVL